MTANYSSGAEWVANLVALGQGTTSSEFKPVEESLRSISTRAAEVLKCTVRGWVSSLVHSQTRKAMKWYAKDSRASIQEEDGRLLKSYLQAHVSACDCASYVLL